VPVDDPLLLSPSSRAGLFAIGEHSIPQSFVGERILTATGGVDHRRSFRRHRPGEGIVPARDAGALRLGERTSHWPVVPRERWLPAAMGLGNTCDRRSRLCRLTRKSPIIGEVAIILTNASLGSEARRKVDRVARLSAFGPVFGEGGGFGICLFVG